MDLAVFAKAQKNRVDRHLVDREEAVTDDDRNQGAKYYRHDVVIDIVLVLSRKIVFEKNN